MVIGAHILLFSDHADEDRAFLRDILNFPSVDAGGGWPIFTLPPAEVAVHPDEATDRDTRGAEERAHLRASLYLMCDDLRATIATLKSKNISCSPIKQERWGILTSVILPSGNELGLYQPKHKLAIKTI